MELSLGLELHSPASQEALNAMAAALAGLPVDLDQVVLDQFAADYADIYLTHAYGASPHESVWLDEDHLMRQEPMFQVRTWYACHGLTTGNWRNCPEDHLALELQFLAHLFAPERGDTLPEAARFMDEHLLRWLPLFARRVAERCRTRFFAALALLTNAYCEELRYLLALILAEPRPTTRSNRTADETGVRSEACAIVLRSETGTDVVTGTAKTPRSPRSPSHSLRLRRRTPVHPSSEH